jgi:hypothetical protein
VRAYAAREELKTYNSRLLDYVKNGGVMIVQYNTPEYDHNFGPYPYSMGENPEEVTDEASKMDILDAKNPVFGSKNAVRNFLSRGISTTRRCSLPTTKIRKRKKVDCYSLATVKAFTSTTPTPSTVSCQRGFRGPSVCLRT